MTARGPRAGWTSALLTASSLLVAGAVAGCGEAEGSARPGIPTLASSRLNGAIVSDEPFLVLPNRAWRRHVERPTWFFLSTASMVCHVLEPPTAPVVFAFVPEEPAPAPPCLEVAWDGVGVSELLRSTATGELQVEIAPEQLTLGTHYLTLRHCAEAGEGEETPLGFSHIGYRFVGEAHELPIDQLDRFQYLSDLLVFGVTGSFGREKLGGLVFDGPQTAAVELHGVAGGRFSTTLQNSSEQPARFAVEGAGEPLELQLAPHERRRLELAVPAGTRHLTLTVDGDPAGCYLWGAPLFEHHSVTARAPIVIVTLDTTRRDVLGAYGSDAGVTPHLDDFAARATLYERAFAPAPWTLPSHASLFTGLYPSRHGAGVVSDHLESSFKTLAEELRARGYLTAGFAGGMLSAYRFGVAQGFAFFRDPDGFETRGDQLTDHVRSFLRAYGFEPGAPGVRRARPLFLWVNYFDPHFPYLAPEPYATGFGVPERVAALADASPWKAALQGSREAWARLVAAPAVPPASARAALRAAYLAEVAFMDEQLGRLFASLREAGLFDPALIIVTADHGELLGEGGYLSHSARLDPELVEIPLLIKWPGQQAPQRLPVVASLVDLYATVLRQLGAPEPETDGVDVAPRLSAALRRTYVLSEEHDTPVHRLFPATRIADDVYALETATFRRVTWDGESECYAALSTGWRRTACPAPDPAGQELLARLMADAWQPQVDRIGLTDSEREILYALDYLR